MKINWDFVSLGSVTQIYNGNSINAEYKKKHFLGVDKGYPFIATKDVGFNGFIDYENGVKIPFDTDYKIADSDSVFICAEGGSAGKKIGYVTQSVCFGNKLFCIKPKQNILKGKYIYYYLQSVFFQIQFQSLLTGLIGGVSANKFKNISIPVPPLYEQERIVSLLDLEFAKIDAIKANAEKQLQDAKDLFQSALKDLLTPKEGWNMVKIGSVFKTYAGGTPLKSRNEYYLNGDIPWINSGEVCQKYIYNCQNTITLAGLNNSSAKYYPINTVLVAMYGATAAQAGILKFEATSNQAVCGLLPNENYLSDFVYYWFVFNKDKFASMAQGGAQPNLSQVKIKEMKIPLMNISQQQKIIDFLDVFEVKIKQLQCNYEQTTTLCNDLKQSILKDIFG